MGKDSEAKSFVKFLISILIPIVLIIIGAGVVALGLNMSSLTVIVIGAVIALAGVLWGGLLMLWHGPEDLFETDTACVRRRNGPAYIRRCDDGCADPWPRVLPGRVTTLSITRIPLRRFPHTPVRVTLR